MPYQKLCLAGWHIADGDGAREEHMSEKPRQYLEEDVLSEAHYDQLLADMQR